MTYTEIVKMKKTVKVLQKNQLPFSPQAADLINRGVILFNGVPIGHYVLPGIYRVQLNMGNRRKDLGWVVV